MVLIRLWPSETRGSSFSLEGMSPGKPRCCPPERLARREKPGSTGEGMFLSLKPREILKGNKLRLDDAKGITKVDFI